MHRVFNNLTVRTIDEEQRVIEGWATRPSRDRASDIVEPLGAEFDLPIPLLLDHDSRSAVGEVERAEVTSQGIRFQARIKKIAEPGAVKDLCDEAWALVKNGLRRATSIGFQPLEWEVLPDGGQRFTRWSWYELSLVVIPCQPEAVIETVKRAPHGRSPGRSSTVKLAGGKLPVVRLSDPAGGKRSHAVVRLTSAEKRLGKMLAEGDRRAAARKRLGIPTAVVKLTAADLVEARLKAAEENRKAKALRRRLGLRP